MSSVLQNYNSTALNTQFSNQRKLDKTSNGVLWAGAVVGAGSARFYYSLDGVTWPSATTFLTFNAAGSGGYTQNYPTVNFSFFIDLDDYMHVVYRGVEDGWTYYVRGTPNASRTSYTWNTPIVAFNNNTSGDAPDIVAHRQGTGWKAHIVHGYNPGSTLGPRPHYVRINITSAGVCTAEGDTYLNSTGYGNNLEAYPSIDFNHTGDGKTVAGGTPHIYTAWSAGKSGAGFGIRFRYASYSGGAWTWNTEVEVDNTNYLPSTAYSINCMYDGTRVYIAGTVVSSTGSNTKVYEINSTKNGVSTNITIGDSNTLKTNYVLLGNTTCDASGNVYFVGRGDLGNNFKVLCWTRATNTVKILDTFTVVNSSPYAIAKHNVTDKIQYIYVDGPVGSTYTLYYNSAYATSAAADVFVWNGATLQPADVFKWDGNTLKAADISQIA